MGRGFFNGSKEGYEKGYSDGLEGRPKSPIGRASEALAHALRPRGYTETFLKEYARGYAEGLRQKNHHQLQKPQASFYQEQFYKEQYFKSRATRSKDLAANKEREEGRGR